MINNNKITQLMPCLVVALVFLCFVACQQQDQPVCQVKTTKPSPKPEKYHVNEGNTTTACTVLQFAGYFEVEPGQYVELNNSTISVNGSSCLPESKVGISFDCGELVFDIGKNTNRTFVKATSGFLHLANSTITPVIFSNSTPDFYSTQGHSYKCSTEQKRPLTQVGGNSTYNLVLSNFLLEGFRNASGAEFYQTPDECGLDSQPVSDLVRIGVGVCLVALVAIVLVAYFIGRRRWSERSSYESV